MELECKGKFCAGLFFRIGIVAVFGFGSKGLHNAELRIFSEDLIDTGAPGGDVIHLTKTPAVRGAA